MSERDPQTTVLCPYCQRQFASGDSLRDHVRMKRRSSAAHGLTDNGTPRPKDEIDAAIERSAEND